MGMKTGLILAITVSLIFMSVMTIFGQEQNVQQGAAITETQNEPETQWLWGEVVSLDKQNKAILVKYLDYETDQEKQIDITADDKTTYENIKSMDEIMPNDTVSIDYIVTPEGKNIAKNISVEKIETAPKPQENNIIEKEPETTAPPAY